MNNNVATSLGLIILEISGNPIIMIVKSPAAIVYQDTGGSGHGKDMDTINPGGKEAMFMR